MATANYDEVTHSAGNVATDWNSIDPLYKWDTHFPERLSRLHIAPEFVPTSTPKNRQRRGRNRTTTRFKTQPITFDEIKEVDEEPGTAEDRKEGLKNQFAAFSRSMDGLVPGFDPLVPPCLRRKHQKMVNQRSDANAAAAEPAMVPCPALTADATAAGNDVKDAPAATPGEETKTKLEEDEAAMYAAVGLNPSLAKVQDVSRARRKKRRSRRSIEEEPELEGMTPSQTEPVAQSME